VSPKQALAFVQRHGIVLQAHGDRCPASPRRSPALVKLATRFRKEQLAKTWNEHTRTGAHRSRRTAFPEWVPSEVMQEAARLSIADAERMRSTWLSLGERRTTKRR
jgi:hypothetical protein